MSLKLNGEHYYRTSEVCRLAGISRVTLLRWISDGIIKDASRRDRRGWRLFTKAEIKAIKAEVNHTS